jgi:hypothetical protein
MKTFHVLMIVILVFACASCSSMGGDTIDTNQYTIPVDAWDVVVEPPFHRGESAALVTIDSSFIWPAPAGEDQQPISYRIDLTTASGETFPNVGRLVERERFAVVMTANSDSAREFLLTKEEREHIFVEEHRLLDDLISLLDEHRQSELPLSDEDGERLDSFVDRVLQEHTDAAHLAELLNSTITLTAFAGNQAVMRQDAVKMPRVRQFDWLERMDKPGDICNGRFPRDCVRIRMTGMKFKFCQARNADGTPRFPALCRKVTQMLDDLTSFPTVVCRIKDASGADAGLAGFVDSNGTMFLDGDTFITSDCADAILIHELIHVLDGPQPNLKKYGDAKADLKRAKVRKVLAKLDGDVAGAATAEQDIKIALHKIKLYQQAAGKERVKTECHAFNTTIDNGDFFDYPGKGTAWMKHNAKTMMSELLDVRSEFNLPHNSPEFCQCLRTLSQWVGGQPPLQDNFKHDAYLQVPGADVMWDQAFNMVPGLYCH